MVIFHSYVKLPEGIFVSGSIAVSERPVQESVPVPAAVPAEVKSAWTAEEALMNRSGCPKEYPLVI